MEIKAATVKNLLEVYQILNEAAHHLHNKGVQQWTEAFDKDVLAESIEQNYIYLLIDETTSIGTFSLTMINHLNSIDIQPNSYYFSKIALLPKWQGYGLGSLIISFAISQANMENKALYLDCWAGNKKLKDFYINQGFTYLGDFREDTYFISIFSIGHPLT
ncbi:GNAT family N-acetyltransferase [Bacillus sp. HMF5848]|uniref:GNAT family N-acetyltransferase n=1 Tax=Bacillus sp. HMF5848 TaxID=2495421 RepID=UPI0016397C53|nr:GNAT family N-acetyltransferase [Bacillus sp. HMF5848]